MTLFASFPGFRGAHYDRLLAGFPGILGLGTHEDRLLFAGCPDFGGTHDVGLFAYVACSLLLGIIWLADTFGILRQV